jgi:hypothetical protein
MLRKGRNSSGRLTKPEAYADAGAKVAAQLRGRKRTPEIIRRGEDHHSAKLTALDVLEIRYLHALGWGARPIARRFGVNRTTISAIVRGKLWSHIP